MKSSWLAVALLLLATPIVPAQSSGPHATLDLVVGVDHAETLSLRFEGLKAPTQYQGICLPARAKESRVYDALGDLSYEAKNEGDRRVVSFLARRDTVFIDMARAAPASTDHPLYSGDVNFCVPQNSGITMNIVVPADHRLFFLSEHGEIMEGIRGTVSSPGPSHVFYSYEAPIAEADSFQVFDEGAFRVFVDPTNMDQAREVARLAALPYEAALDEAGLPRPFDAIRVRFAHETPYAWEAGHYNGHGYITVKVSALEDDPTKGFPYAGVKVLVHEAFHAASFPYGQGGITDKTSWFLEGSARYAERQVDRVMPNATIYCEQSSAERRCWSFDDRLSREQLEAGYRSSFTFDPRWEPSLPQDDDTRRFYYAFSELVVGAWIAQRGEGAYAQLWDTLLPAFNDDKGCPCGDGWLIGLMPADDLFRPWGDVHDQDPAGFEARIAPFLKDDKRLQDAVEAGRGPLGDLGIALPGWIVLAAVAGALALTRRGRRA